MLCSGWAQAEVLVTATGERIETKGAWKVQGQRVIYRLPSGALAAMRLDSVDLEASERAQQDGALETVGAPAVKKPVHVITAATVANPAASRATGNEPDAAGGESTAASDPFPATSTAPAEASSPAAAPEPGLVIGSWKERIDTTLEGMVIEGSLDNERSDIVTDFQLEVVLLDDSGEIVARQLARLEADELEPGTSTPFRADFRGTYEFEEVRFASRRGGFRTKTTEDPENAVQPLERARDLLPASPKVRYALAQAYQGAGRTPDGQTEIQAYQELQQEKQRARDDPSAFQDQLGFGLQEDRADLQHPLRRRKTDAGA